MEYPKIETAFDRDKKTFKVDTSHLRKMVYGTISLWQFTEKIDGQNVRIEFNDDKMSFHGRTDNAADLPKDLQAYMNERVNIEKLREMFQSDVTIFGEGFGPGIQKGEGYSKTKKFQTFDVLVDHKWWLDWPDVVDVSKKLGFDTVPFLGDMTLKNGILVAQQGFESLIYGAAEGKMAEGLVGRPIQTLYDKQMKRIIIKLKTIDF